MSYHVLPIIFLNLGGEMFYVLDQRLKAQKIAPTKAKKVMDEIAILMFNPKFLDELFKPQKIYNKHALYTLFRDIAHASIMKLSDTSMGKLYDLMIMVFKYQMFSTSHPPEMLLITLNHLDSLRQLVTSPIAHRQLNIAYFQLSKTYFTMNSSELQRIRYEILNFLQDVRTKVSIFLRKGQQNVDGTFVIPLINTVPYGAELPGITKFWNHDGSIRDIINFSSGGENTMQTGKGGLDLNCKRETQLGMSVYNETFNNPENLWWEYDDSGLNKWNAANTITTYRDELNTLVTELLGNKSANGDSEILELDLFQDHSSDMYQKPDNDLCTSLATVTIDTNQETNSYLQKVVTEMEELENIPDQKPDLLQLLESMD